MLVMVVLGLPPTRLLHLLSSHTLRDLGGPGPAHDRDCAFPGIS